MNILKWVALYFAISIVITVVISKIASYVRGYSVKNFYDLKPDEQWTLVGTILFWPIVVLFIIIYVILDIITKITNRKDGVPK